ncbi:serine/threonine-protein phosphatase 6 regulatory subunit 3-like protein [Leptotrombidium deliense]|uniref:Serine/threonine-protein phosphatase 6 regulatory subunit 3-like protein n=1 Tax=Leptotrombidium deliense TaxID=299467 RepID=A0A443SUA1_9ACAR|nr:serine/threonine-protein phosphatase 6 regulatory subunit 3-like protein [Leptotrombidium deliense]
MASNPIFSRMDLTGSDQMTALDAERLSRCVQQVHAAIIPRLSDFHIILLNPPERPAIHTTVGVIEKPLGATRLEVVHLIRALLSSNNPGINQKICELKTVPVLIDLFFSYPWNNFLHTQVEQSIKSILNNAKSNSPVTSPTVADGDSSHSSQEVTSLLVDQLFSDARLIERIIDIWESYHADDTSTKQPRPGYMGHVIKIANNIVLNKDQDAVLNATKLISDEYKRKWDFFVDKTLSDINKRMQTPLVNEVPTATAFDKNAIRQQENALQQAFIEYQMQQMTRSLCTQIEFNAAEFNEIDDNIQAPVDHMARVNYNLENQLESSRNVDVFEQMCAERIRTSLDSNSSDEEDLWESTDRDMSFTRSNMSENRNQSSIQVFGTNSGDVAEMKMDVDQTDAWNDVPSSNVTSVLDPWASPKESNSKEKLVSDSSWADFSTFNDFHSSQAAPPNMCISVSSVMPSSSDTSIFPSSGDPGITSVTTDSELRENNEDLDVGCEVSNVVEEKDSEVSSSIDNVLNGPH